MGSSRWNHAVGGDAGRLLRTLVALASLGVALSNLAACGSDPVCPLGTTGSPCMLVGEPGDRPEIPSRSEQDIVVPDAGPPDAGVDDDVESEGDAPNDASADEDTGDEDTSAAAGMPAAARRSAWTVGGNGALDRDTPNTTDGGGLGRAVSQARGGVALSPARPCDGVPATRTNSLETSDDDGFGRGLDVWTPAPRGRPHERGRTIITLATVA